MKKHYLSIVLLFASVLTISAQTSYQNVIGGSGNERAYHSIVNSAGNTVIVSTTSSYGAGGTDILLSELNPSGSLVLSKTYGGVANEIPRHIEQTSDGGYIITGSTTSFGAGSTDVYVIKITSLGLVTWSNSYGDANSELGTYIHEIAGGYLLIGYSYSWGFGQSDAFFIKLNSTGVVTSATAYGHIHEDFITATTPDSYGGYLLAGAQENVGAGLYDHWYLHVDNDGNVDYSIDAGSTDNEAVVSAVQSSNGDFLLGGHIRQNGAGGVDMAVVRLSRQGTVLWSKAFGGTGDEAATSLLEAANGDIVFTGNTNSFGPTGENVITILTNSSGVEQWSNIYGKSADDVSNSITADANGYKVTGGTLSFGNGEETYAITIDAAGSSPSSCEGTISATSYSPTVTDLTSTVMETTISVTAVSAATQTSAPAPTVTGVMTICTVTGVHDADDDQVESIFPVPVNNTLYFTTAQTAEFEYSIYSLTGILYASGVVSSGSGAAVGIDVEQVPAGAFVIVFKNEAGESRQLGMKK